MRAIIHTRYGESNDLVLGDVPIPRPSDDEVLLRVRAASMHADVWHVVAGLPYVLRLMGNGLLRPKRLIPGTDVAGVVEAVGGNVTRFKPGDEVFGETLKGHQWQNGGAYAEYVAAPEMTLVHKPSNVSFEQAAAVPTAGLIALQNLRTEGRLGSGQQVLINGAGGGVGTLAVQIAKAMGARVIAVDRTDKLSTLSQLGADEVVDYQRHDFTEGSARYDLVLDIPGNHPFGRVRRVLTPDGVYVYVAHDNYGRGMRRWFGQLPRMTRLATLAFFTRNLPKPSFAMPDKRSALVFLAELLENGGLCPIIDRTFPLQEVPDALRYMTSGAAKGKIVIVL